MAKYWVAVQLVDSEPLYCQDIVYVEGTNWAVALYKVLEAGRKIELLDSVKVFVGKWKNNEAELKAQALQDGWKFSYRKSEIT